MTPGAQHEHPDHDRHHDDDDGSANHELTVPRPAARGARIGAVHGARLPTPARKRNRGGGLTTPGSGALAWDNAGVAQLEAQPTCNRQAVGSSPTTGSIVVSQSFWDRRSLGVEQCRLFGSGRGALTVTGPGLATVAGPARHDGDTLGAVLCEPRRVTGWRCGRRP